MKAKFKVGQLVYDPSYDMVGMIKGTFKDHKGREWFRVHMFGDPWCASHDTRDYTYSIANQRLEAYDKTPQR